MDLRAQLSATEASESEAASNLARTKSLAATGYQTAVAVERAERDAKVATQNQKSLNHRLFASEVELEAARRGEYVGDFYNDRPSSLQHADELSVRVVEAEAELASATSESTGFARRSTPNLHDIPSFPMPSCRLRSTRRSGRFWCLLARR